MIKKSNPQFHKKTHNFQKKIQKKLTNQSKIRKKVSITKTQNKN